jgi:hypothetical protein
MKYVLVTQIQLVDATDDVIESIFVTQIDSVQR